jgi:multidrug efflux system membrane fusion protein
MHKYFVLEGIAKLLRGANSMIAKPVRFFANRHNILSLIPIATNNFLFKPRESCRQINDRKRHSIKSIQCHLRSLIFGALTRLNRKLFVAIGISRFVKNPNPAQRARICARMSFAIPSLMIASLLCCSCHKKQAQSPTPSYPVQISEAKTQDIPIFIEALGHVQPITSIDIYSRIEGELTGIYFNQGQEVKKGDLLFTIDPKPYQAQLKTAQGTLEETLANLSLSEEKVRRFKTLTRDEFFSQIDYESLQASMAALLAQTVSNQGQVDSANINLDYCWIYAPIDGMTGILNIDYGNLICANCQNPLITLNQMAPIFVTFSIPEFQLPKIQKAHREKSLKVEAAYEDFKSNEIFEGSLYMLDNAVDPKTGMIKLRAIFENTNRELWPGQFIRNRLILYTMKDAVTIPFTAIQMTQTNPILFIVNDNMTVTQRTVKLGQRQDDTIVILEGLKAGEKIVVEGQMNLYSGSKVFVPRGKQP